MRTRDKLFISLFTFINIINLNVFADTTTRTVKQKIENNTSQTCATLINIPYGVSINRITLDNGKIVSASIDKSKGTLIVVVTGGRTNQIYNPKKYPKTVTKVITEDYKSNLPSYTYVSTADEYSGSIPLDYTKTTTESKYVTGKASVVEDFYWRCDNVGYLTPNKAYDSTKTEDENNTRYIYDGADWSGNHRNFNDLAYYISPDWSGTPDYYGGISYIYYEDDDGYSGTGYASYSESPSKSDEVPYSALYIPAWQNNWVLPEPYKRAHHYSIMNRYTLEAEVSKIVYEGYYEGEIYKPGYDDVYTYNLTVEYEEDNLDIYEMHSTEWTNKDLNITLSSNSYFFNLFKFDTLYKYIKPSTFSVSKNGTYKFYVSDYGHDRTIRTTSISVDITNIDKTIPYGMFSPNSRTSWAGDISVGFTPLDSGGSGVKQWRYCVSTNDGVSYGPYSQYYTKGSFILLNQDGKNNIKVEIEDVAGNIGYVYSGSYYVDKIPPTLKFTPTGCSWRNTPITSTWVGEDTASLVKSYKFRITTINGYSTSTTEWSKSDISNTQVLIEKEGLSLVEVIVEDNAGNSKSYVSNQFSIDKTAPTLTINVEPFIKDTYKEIPINLSDVKDNLVGVSHVEASLLKDFSKKVSVPYISNTTSYNVLLPRYGLSFEQTLYVRVTDLLGNTRTYMKNIYLDPLPPEIPNILSPEDILIVNSEKLKLEWDYKDPGDFKLLKTDLIFVNRENNETTTHTITGGYTEAYIDPSLEFGVYNLTVKVYNTENKFTESKVKSQIRKNRFKVEGNLCTQEIDVVGKPIRFVKVNLDVAKQDIPDIDSKIKSYADIYIVSPEEDGTFNIQNSNKVFKYNLSTDSDAFRIPGDKVNKLLILVKMKSDDKEYSRITPWLDGISVSVR